jgi:hypothetical protein
MVQKGTRGKAAEQTKKKRKLDDGQAAAAAADDAGAAATATADTASPRTIWILMVKSSKNLILIATFATKEDGTRFMSDRGHEPTATELGRVQYEHIDLTDKDNGIFTCFYLQSGGEQVSYIELEEVTLGEQVCSYINE